MNTYLKVIIIILLSIASLVSLMGIFVTSGFTLFVHAVALPAYLFMIDKVSRK